MSTADWMLPLTIGAASLVALSLGVLQSDFAGRTLFLSEQQVQSRREREYKYRWQQALSRAVLRIKYAWAGGNMQSHDEEVEFGKTVVYSEDRAVEDFCSRLTSNKMQNVIVLRIGEDTRNGSHYVWFAENADKFCTHQIPVHLVASVMSNHFNNVITTSVFCFIADATGNMASPLIADLHAAVAEDWCLVKRPFWLVCLVVLIESKKYSASTLEKVFFSLCRLEAGRRGAPKTVIVTIPGQAIIPQVLRLVQVVFPDDRLVFVYASCMRTVSFRRQKRAYSSTHIAMDIDSAVQFHDNVADSTPLCPTRLVQSANVMKPFISALSKLCADEADSVQSWLASLDCFLTLKEEDKDFLPYCCKLELLLSEPVDGKNDVYWSLRSLLQYITGSRSHGELPQKGMDAAINVLNVAHEQWKQQASKCDSKAIQNCVFQHKLILIENKTIKDTCLPAEHWTLKASGKRGCACCLIEEEDEPAAGAGFGSGGYVDGKAVFAFDPNNFR